MQKKVNSVQKKVTVQPSFKLVCALRRQKRNLITEWCVNFFDSVLHFYREALSEIFDSCDLDGNGSLSREEFDLFQFKSGGDLCDDDAWEIMKGKSPHIIFWPRKVKEIQFGSLKGLEND